MKTKIIAILLNIFVIGTGYFYLGKFKKSFLVLPLLFFIVYISLYIALIYHDFYTLLTGYLIVIFIYGYTIYDIIKIINNNQHKKTKYRRWYFVILYIVICLSVVSIAKVNITSISPITTFKTPSNSMSPTIKKDEIFIATRINKLPNRGDIVAFQSPKNINIYYVKRCVAIEGDIVFIKNKKLYLHPDKTDEVIKNTYPKEDIITISNTLFVKSPYQNRYTQIYNDSNITKQNTKIAQLFDIKPIQVPKGSVFVLGDNRDHSLDSRFIGFIPLHLIYGKAQLIYKSNISKDRIGRKLRW